jgi:hypothetical protein
MSIFQSVPWAIFQTEITWEQVWIFFLGILLFRNAIILSSKPLWTLTTGTFLLIFLWPIFR